MAHVPTRLPVALDGLLAAARAALPAVSVVDGPPLTGDGVQLARAEDEVSEDAYLFVGGRVDDEASIGSTEQSYNSAGNLSRDEQGSFTSTILCRSGDEGAVKDVRDAAFAVLAAVEQIIRDDQTLGGAVLYARLASLDSYVPDQGEDGVTVWLQFTVAYRAYLT